MFPLAIDQLSVLLAAAAAARRPCHLVGNPHDLVAEHLVGQDEDPLHVGHGRRFGRQLDDHVVALALVLELVGEGPPSPALDLARVSTLGPEGLERPGREPRSPPPRRHRYRK